MRTTPPPLALLLIGATALVTASFTPHHVGGARSAVRRAVAPPPLRSPTILLSSAAPAPTPPSAPSSQKPRVPSWVNNVNRALESGASAYVLTYLVLDLGGAFLLMVLFLALRVNVQADFALAFAISKSPPLRGPRLALDSAAAACLSRLYPPLTAVRTSLLADAMARLTNLDALSARLGGGGGDSAAAETTADSGGGAPASTSPETIACGPDAPAPAPPPSRLASAASSAAAKARRVADEYGLAYLLVKNVFGPLSIALIYTAIRASTASRGGGGGGALGRAAGAAARLSLGPGAAALDAHVGLPSAGQAAGCVALASTISSLLFPLVVLGAARLAPRVGAWAQGRVAAADEQKLRRPGDA